MRVALQNRTPGYNGGRDMGSRSNAPINFSVAEKRQRLSDEFQNGTMNNQNNYSFTPRPHSRNSNRSMSSRSMQDSRRNVYYESSHNDRSVTSHHSRHRQDVPQFVMSPIKNNVEEGLTEPQFDTGRYSDDDDKSQPLL